RLPLSRLPLVLSLPPHSLFFLYSCLDHPHLHSFPTRRSSDLSEVRNPLRELRCRRNVRTSSTISSLTATTKRANRRSTPTGVRRYGHFGRSSPTICYGPCSTGRRSR